MGKVWVEFQASISIFIELNSHLQAFLSTVPFQTLIIPLVVRRKNTVGLFRSITDFFVFVYYVRLRQPIFRTFAGFWVWGWSVVSDIVLKKKHPRIWRSEHSFHSWCFWRSKYGIVIDPLSHWRIIIMLFIFAKTWRTSRTSCSYCKNWSLQVALIVHLLSLDISSATYCATGRTVHLCYRTAEHIRFKYLASWLGYMNWLSIKAT